MDWVYHYMEYFESSNMKIPTCIHGRLKSYVHARRKLAQSKIQALIEIENKDEEFLDMRNMAEYMPLESATKGDYVLMGWVDKYITEIEDQGRTIIACISRRLFNMHTLKGKHPNISLCLVDSSIEDVFDHITYGYENKSPCSYIDLVDRDIIEIKTLGGKGLFYFCNTFFVVTDIFLTCEHQ